MTLSYSVRLLCICFSSFYLVHGVLVLALDIAAPGAIELARGMKPRLASGFLFALRMMPVWLAGFGVLALCVPSYLLLEPRLASEGGRELVGWPCVVLTLLGVGICIGSFVRAAKAVFGSLAFRRACGGRARKILVDGEFFRVIVVKQKAPLLAVAGILGHRLVVSSSVLRALSAGELGTAMRHERAHQNRHDNFKRLLLLAAPRGFVLGRGLDALERNWARFAEWAADDHAVGGDTDRAVSLAAALVRLARLGSCVARPVLLSSLGDGRDLSERVDRLLRVEPTQQKERISTKVRAAAGIAAFVAACCAAAALGRFASLGTVHQLLERLIG
jgi:Zn-dependent protease with chaperone function